MGLGLTLSCDRDAKVTSAAVRKAVAATAAGHGQVHMMSSGSQTEVDSFILSIAQKRGMEGPFYVLDLGLLVQLFHLWVKALPRVKPFYAVKCSPDPALLSTLAALGAGFDCASKAEIAQVLALGVPCERVLFANPCKMQSHVTYAASVGVNIMTFDCESEVHKVRACHPNAVLLLRIRTDDRGARCPLGVKYGALMSEVEPLLTVAADHGVPVAGVSFHIGSGATDALSFTDAIAAAREVFDIAARLQLPPMDILDIGGGFTAGVSGALKFVDAAAAVNAALEKYFPVDMGVTIIAEPGRYFAESPSTLATMVMSKRVRGSLKEYWINDGIYGSMNCLLYDHALLGYRPLAVASQEKTANVSCLGLPLHNSTVFGPTCDGLDTVLSGALLPELAINDWVVFPNMGAYTAAAGSSFNGFATSEIPTFYTFSNGAQLNLKALGFLKGLILEDVLVENCGISRSGSGRLITVASGGVS